MCDTMDDGFSGHSSRFSRDSSVGDVVSLLYCSPPSPTPTADWC